jgi:hypothetical protein
MCHELFGEGHETPAAQTIIQMMRMEAPMAVRTTLRSTSGTKLHAVRDSKGWFVDIQTYKCAHGQDIKRRSKQERSKKCWPGFFTIAPLLSSVNPLNDLA